jgi:hypothetical protein
VLIEDKGFRYLCPQATFRDIAGGGSLRQLGARKSRRERFPFFGRSTHRYGVTAIQHWWPIRNSVESYIRCKSIPGIVIVRNADNKKIE